MTRKEFSLLIFVCIFSAFLVTTGKIIAASPISTALENYDVKSSSDPITVYSASTTKVKKTAGVILNTDGLYRTANDIAFMEKFKKELTTKYGINAVVSPYCCQADDHVKTIKNCPKGYWVVNAASGICAGTYRDMVIGIKKGYLKKAWEDRNIQGMIILNLSTKYLLKDVKYLKRAWDDNFSPKSFKGIENPYQYIVDAGFYVVESPLHREKLLSDGRVPVLAEQIARIILGDATITANGKSGEVTSTKFITLKRLPEKTASDPQVVELQKALQANGYYQNCKIDGWFGPYTALAVMEFERAAGLRVTGVVTEGLFSKIKSDAKK
ncbi:MAG: peptidoglycan-binding protein [Candidatus Riflebacteria bacterium]|nr:peptidoglycan-binding protein [Candidatus Riflebacteria bacterium]